MQLNGAIQEALVAMLCYDKQRARLISSLVPARTFDPFYRDIAAEAVKFIDQYDVPPGEHTLDIVEQLAARDPESEEILHRLLLSIEDTKDNINPEYVLAQAQDFARFQRMKSGITKALEVLQGVQNGDGSLNEAEAELMRGLQHSHEAFDVGIALTDTDRSLAFLEQEHKAFDTGIKEIDARGLGPARKRLHVFGALPGRGKSWWLVHLARTLLLQRQKVLYVTLELDEAEVSQRLIQCLFSVQKRSQVCREYKLQKDEYGRVEGFDEVTLQRPTLADANIKKTLREKITAAFKNRPQIYVKQFPTSQLTARDLESYLDALESSKKFIPDVILLDYADLMTIDTDNFRVATGQIYKQLRGIAIKRNLAVVTCSQVNRSAEGVALITEKHIAEDFSKIATADVFMTFNQTKEEKAAGLARLYLAKGRTDADKFTVLISQDYTIGQFCVDSAKLVSNYTSLIPQDQEVDDD